MSVPCGNTTALPTCPVTIEWINVKGQVRIRSKVCQTSMPTLLPSPGTGMGWQSNISTDWLRRKGRKAQVILCSYLPFLYLLPWEARPVMKNGTFCLFRATAPFFWYQNLFGVIWEGLVYGPFLPGQVTGSEWPCDQISQLESSPMGGREAKF